MNNKELQAELAKRLSLTQKEAAEFLSLFTTEYSKKFEVYDETQIPFLKLGNMSIKKKEQRIIANPITKTKMLVPPKLSVFFKPALALKNRIKSEVSADEDTETK